MCKLNARIQVALIQARILVAVYNYIDCATSYFRILVRQILEFVGFVFSLILAI